MATPDEKTLFQRLCREAGEITGLIIKPVKPVKKEPGKVEQVSRKETTEVKQVSETVIIRRTVIEEVEIKKP